MIKCQVINYEFFKYCDFYSNKHLFNISNKKNDRYKIKEIQSIINEPPIVNQFQINLWTWISNYYMCCIGEVFHVSRRFRGDIFHVYMCFCGVVLHVSTCLLLYVV